MPHNNYKWSDVNFYGDIILQPAAPSALGLEFFSLLFFKQMKFIVNG